VWGGNCGCGGDKKENKEEEQNKEKKA